MTEGKSRDASKQSAHLRMGERGEDLAAAYLREKGWEIETRNYTTDHGEIDIVARRAVREGTLIAFVEVKSRKSSEVNAPELSVTARKRRTITGVARRYAAQFERRDTGYRFDVITVDMSEDPPAIHHFEGAFDSQGNPY